MTRTKTTTASGYDGVIYDATCPVCGEEISFDEDTLAEGSIECPNCGEKLEFDLGDDDKDEDKEFLAPASAI